MKETLMNMIKDINSNNDIMEQFFEILDLEDNKFNIIYPELKNNIINAFNSNATKKAIINQLEMMPEFNLNKELEELEKTIKDVKDDNSL